ncbi:Lrp/AsnC family transcriptional regulator [Rathayibacter soli]|uniref:Lrp/AsnC family transcriptional regulator n=1 Tax=Rathayibacter soli TaxID=3144168 RepID=UPI0027E4B600|nr:Lrp/AsnC family transcriptional regulator [Glaciibacter superstes]
MSGVDIVESKNAQLDRIDRALIRALSQNARASGSVLATSIGVAESTVSMRLRRLQERGFLRGYRLDIDLAALGASLQALIAVRLVKHSRDQVIAFRDAAPSWPGVLSMFHTGGADDYLLHVAAHNASELRDFVLDYLTGHPAVAHTETTLIFDHAVGDGWQHLLDGHEHGL